MTQDDRNRSDFPKKPPLVPLRVRGNAGVWSVLVAAVCGLGLFLLTGLSPTPWLFLLYPLFIGGLLLSLAVLALALMRRL
jgi:hypothetical protein